MEMTQLPAVAKSFVMYCPKCDGDKFHTVLVHVSSDTAKVQCDICKKKSTFKMSEFNKSAKLAGGLSESPLSTSKASNSKMTAAKFSTAKPPSKSKGPKKETGARQNQLNKEHESLYLSLMSKTNQEPMPYAVTALFKVGNKLDHKKFGQGVVVRLLDDRIEVVFEKEVKLLVTQPTQITQTS